MAYSRRSYKGAAVANALASGTLAAGATSITLASSMVGWSTGSNPFFVVIDPGTAKEEKVCVIYNTATTLTVVDPNATGSWSASSAGRGCDDTQDRQHDGGAVIYPVFTAVEANQANELVSKYTTNGDIVVHGSTGFKTVSTGGSGSNGKALVADSTISDGGVKWGQVTVDGIADNAVTNAKMADNAVGAAEIINGSVGLDELATAVINRLVPVGTIAMYGGASAPTGWLLCDGATIDAGYTALKAIVGNNTPDLKGRFAIGDNSTLTLLGTGGSSTIAEANLPSHTHTFSATSGGMSANSTPGHTVNDSGHAHTLDVSTTSGGVAGVLNYFDGGTVESGYVNGAVTGISVDAHNIAHTHSVSGTTNGGTGSGTAYYQPYLVVNYIIKHD